MLAREALPDKGLRRAVAAGQRRASADLPPLDVRARDGLGGLLEVLPFEQVPRLRNIFSQPLVVVHAAGWGPIGSQAWVTKALIPPRSAFFWCIL